MARITVEDCLEQVDNRFQLVLTTTKRARQIANGGQPFLPWENDKPTVVALREVAEGYVTPQWLRETAAAEAIEQASAEAAERSAAAEGSSPEG